MSSAPLRVPASSLTSTTTASPAFTFSPSSPPDEPAAKKHKTETSHAASAASASASATAPTSVGSSSLQSPIPPAPRFHPDTSSGAARSPPDNNSFLCDSDLSATPVLLHTASSSSSNGAASAVAADLFSSPPASNSTVPASAAAAAPSSTSAQAAELSSRVASMFHDEAKSSQVAAQQSVAEHKSSSSVSAAAAAGKPSASGSNSMSAQSSQNNSQNNSRAQSPVDDGAGKEDVPMQSASSASAAAAAQPQQQHQPAAKPNNTAKSSDPSGQTIAEAELEGKFKVIRYLGKGSYGTVFVAEELATGKQVAIKKIPKCFDNLTNAKRLLREIKILRMLSHHNVIGYRGLLLPSIPATFNSLLIVFEFVDTDLAKLLASDQPITNQHVQYFLYQLLCGIHYIHSANIIHRDIKPANVLINADCSMKICDFGLSRSTLGPNATAAQKARAEEEIASAARKQREALANAPLPQQARQVSTEKVSLQHQPPPQKLARELTKHVVTRWYRAPEVILLSDRYTTAIDMWSIGCIFSELLSMQTRTSRRALFPGRTCFPFSADNNPLAYTDQLDQLNVIFDVIGTPSKDEIEKIDNDRARSYLRSLPFKAKIDLPRRFAGADPQAVDLLQKLLFFDPSKRFTAKQALEHPYLAEFRQPEDEGVYVGGSVDFAFEDQPITKDQIKALIVEQILIDNPASKLADFFPNGTTVGSAAASTAASAALAKEAAENHKRKMQAEAK